MHVPPLCIQVTALHMTIYKQTNNRCDAHDTTVLLGIDAGALFGGWGGAGSAFMDATFSPVGICD
jgi:hypothetical protein